MEEKTKTSWEHFYNYLFTISEEKHEAQQKVYWGCNAGKDEREVWGATIIQATYKSGHNADLTRD